MTKEGFDEADEVAATFQSVLSGLDRLKELSPSVRVGSLLAGAEIIVKEALRRTNEVAGGKK